MTEAFPQGAVHTAGPDLEAAVRTDPGLMDLWAGLTPLAATNSFAGSRTPNRRRPASAGSCA